MVPIPQHCCTIIRQGKKGLKFFRDGKQGANRSEQERGGEPTARPRATTARERKKKDENHKSDEAKQSNTKKKKVCTLRLLDCSEAPGTWYLQRKCEAYYTHCVTLATHSTTDDSDTVESGEGAGVPT